MFFIIWSFIDQYTGQWRPKSEKKQFDIYLFGHVFSITFLYNYCFLFGVVLGEKSIKLSNIIEAWSELTNYCEI